MYADNSTSTNRLFRYTAPTSTEYFGITSINTTSTAISRLYLDALGPSSNTTMGSTNIAFGKLTTEIDGFFKVVSSGTITLDFQFSATTGNICPCLIEITEF
jgi:hypothetical protein